MGPPARNLKGSDGQGRLCSVWKRSNPALGPPCRVLDSLAVLPPSGQTELSGRMGGMSFSLRGVLNPFPPEVQWAVAADGRLAVVYPDPCRVEMIGWDGAPSKDRKYRWTG